MVLKVWNWVGNSLFKLMISFSVNRRGATAIEYGLIAAGISVAVGAIALLVGDDIVALFVTIRDRLGEAT